MASGVQKSKAVSYGAICSGVGAGIMGVLSQTNAMLSDGGPVLCFAFSWGTALLVGRAVVANFFPPQSSDDAGK